VRWLALTWALAAPVAAGALDLSLPIDCTLGEDCYIQQYVDHDTTPAAQDYRCGTLSYDGHDGTDFGIPTLADMARGVPVLAAADGEVTGIRNDMPDAITGTPDAPDIAGRECGNGVLLRHPEGWETQYCHLRQGSVTVQPGDLVRAGDTLGLVGLSGMTEFPHLHLSVRQNGVAVDPFVPDGQTTCNTPPADTLWTTPPAYTPGGLLTLGFAADVPDYDAIKASAPIPPPDSTTPLVLWGYFFGGQQGDIAEITITGPAGSVITHTALIDSKQGLFFRAAGRRAPDGGWPAGRYGGTIRLLRDGTPVDSATATLTLD
jgi:murein DD-endopeptidase MepM/ murein hydrolase activator NlpD